MAIIKRTVEEAKDYIAESLKHWEEAKESKKIISLAAFAEKWRSKTTGPITQIKSLQKSIRGLELNINRIEKVGIPSPNLQKSLDTLKKMYNELVAKHGEPKNKITKKNIEQPNVQ